MGFWSSGDGVPNRWRRSALRDACAAGDAAAAAVVHKPQAPKESPAAKKTFRQFAMRTLSTFLNYQIGGIIWCVAKGSLATYACLRA